jgi:Fur family transcriptional regulator, ferric uptake regulator
MADHAHGDPPGGSDLHEELRARGFRLTPQRQLVLEAVEELGHATPEKILTVVRQKVSGVNMSTIYRTLELLEELQLVSHAHLGDRAPTYHAITTPDHAHLVCRSCGRVSEVASEEVEPLSDALRDRHGFTMDVRHLAIFGSCTNCSK